MGGLLGGGTPVIAGKLPLLPQFHLICHFLSTVKFFSHENFSMIKLSMIKAFEEKVAIEEIAEISAKLIFI